MSKITYSDSTLKEMRDLTDQLYTKMGKTPYSWGSGANTVISIANFNKVNEVIDAVESSYSAGNSAKSCSSRYGTNNSTKTYTSYTNSVNETAGNSSKCSSVNSSQRANICNPRD